MSRRCRSSRHPPSFWRSQRFFATLNSTDKELKVEQRVAKAERGGADELCALCFDPSPRVIAAVLQNVALTAVHARMIARNHGARAGLDRLGSKPKLLNDKLVQRALLRNRWCSDELCSKVLRGRSMNQLYLD